MNLGLLAACVSSIPVSAEPPDVPAPVVVLPEPLPTSGPFRRELAPGLIVAAHDAPDIPDEGFSSPDPAAVRGTDRRLFVVTIDLAHYELVYLSSLDPTSRAERGVASRWLEPDGLHVAWNPGMFEPSGAATGYTRAGAFTSQPEVRRGGLYRSWFVADPAAQDLPAVAVVDHVPPKGAGTWGPVTDLPAPFAAQLREYGLVSQSLPILRDGRAAYPPREKQWSELAYGADRDGNVVVVFSRYPYEMRELGKRIEALDLGIVGLLHGEGGPEASLVVRVDGVELVLFGGYETGFSDDTNDRQWPLPAVMGARPRK